MNEEIHRIADLLEHSREYGRDWKAQFKLLSENDQIEWLANQIYVSTYVDPHGYPNGLPFWSELPEIDIDFRVGVDKERYRHAAKYVVSLLK